MHRALHREDMECAAMYYVGIERTPIASHPAAVLEANKRLKRYRVGDEVPVYANSDTDVPYFSL